MKRDEFRRKQKEAQVDNNVTATYEPDQDESLTEVVVRGVSSVLNCNQMELEPLYSAVDTDALNALFRTTNGVDRCGGHVAFNYANCNVTVHGMGFVTIEAQNEPTRVEDN